MINPLVSADVLRERLAVCTACANLKGYVVLRCALCGCSVKAKSMLKRESCPAEKWPAVTVSNDLAHV